ncbi:MAG: tetratricopeptide repeat protein [Nostoc sp.]|uniref:tetratricopeptide repeat protein n=1 Tax=Nostoc sp. TaxID=1180 RepID=UPI002FF4DEC1
MEPLTTAAIAVGTIIATKALEKTGEKVGETLWDKTGKFLVTLKKHSPYTVAVIEKALSMPEDSGKYAKKIGAFAASGSQAEPLYTQALEMSDRILGVNHPTTATIRENLAILQRQSTPRPIWKRRLGQFVQILLAMLILQFSRLWRSLKRLIRN